MFLLISSSLFDLYISYQALFVSFTDKQWSNREKIRKAKNIKSVGNYGGGLSHMQTILFKKSPEI